MNKVLLLSFIFCLLQSLGVNAQTKMRDVFANAPDSIFPLLTKNNKLDCIDFYEAGMEAVVKDRLDGKIMLTMLKDDYLCIATSLNSVVMMKLVAQQDDRQLLYVCRTYLAPTMDSEVRCYDTAWNFICQVRRPQVSEFLKEGAPDDLRMELEMLPLIIAGLNKDSNTLTWEIQTGELSNATKKAASEYLQPVIVSL